ncbi:MAG: HEAT repeat domain-containing protein [Planctomycetia bacterium]|nr:HEAT repeat domain-containing protein [Planctomycetia bacterium]
MRPALIICVTAVLGLAWSAARTIAVEPTSFDAALRSFSERWSQDDWVPKTGVPSRFMRPLDDDGWKARMTAFQSAVQFGERAVEPVRQLLRDEDASKRALAAQVLGYLPARTAREELLRTAREDAEPAVRLYAIDSLGMLGTDGLNVDWKALADQQKNRDAKRHVTYASERANNLIAKEVIDQLTSWNASQMDTAQVGQPAPDFELSSVSGEKVRLSNFRGKSAVVLVFVYGDT